MSEVKLTAVKRTAFGKGAARRLRRDHQVPAVIYGHGTDPVHISLPGHATMLALKKSNTLLTLDVEGIDTLALPKDVQRDPLRGTIEHVDLLVVRRGERVTIDVALHVVGDPAPATRVSSETNSLSIEALATAIPTHIDVDIAGRGAGTQIHAGDIPLPEGAVLITDPGALVVHISAEAAEAEEPDAAAADA